MKSRPLWDSNGTAVPLPDLYPYIDAEWLLCENAKGEPTGASQFLFSIPMKE
ncbi:MAG: hypothetical protein V7K72_23630 [Nostoc sp.]|uniref:hypothetical protein n=1 Tax=Nostoc sp. TaxID=1180 RepID=UPI002FF68FAA